MRKLKHSNYNLWIHEICLSKYNLNDCIDKIQTHDFNPDILNYELLLSSKCRICQKNGFINNSNKMDEVYHHYCRVTNLFDNLCLKVSIIFILGKVYDRCKSKLKF